VEQSKILNQKWLKASVLGCLWASSEIVLGSFLHNLRIPFSGSILTAIGIILLISVSYLWNERGLFWRSGLVCALMKAISPSAVIWGPMIAIFSEAILMEISVRILGRNILGFVVAGMLAMSWNIFHKTMNFIIFYGFNIVELYKNLTKYALKQLNIHSENVWLPILVLFTIYLILGLFSAILGIYIGKKAKKNPLEIEGISFKKVAEIQSKTSTEKFNYSVYWLGFNIVAIISFLFILNISNWIYWTIFGATLITIWAIRYNKALKPLKKPKFWISFVIITMLTSFLFAKFQKLENGMYDGLMIGLEMNFRAVIMIIGFSTLGKEFSSPFIRRFFMKSKFKQLLLALEVAFETLPFVVANLPSFKDIFKRPISIFLQLISQADFWLEKLTIRMAEKPQIIIITGKTGEGKSTLLNQIIEDLKNKNIHISGFISLSVLSDNQRVGYDLIDLNSNSKTELSRTFEIQNSIKIGKFYFQKSGIEFGKNALTIESTLNSQLICIDEVGPWELDNKGWASSINNLLLHSKTPMILIVRERLVNEVIENWNLKNYKVFNVAESECEDVVEYYLECNRRTVIGKR
jgi:nucleoside-triphosphatase THEP1